MYEYKFIKIKLGFFLRQPEGGKDYHEVVRKYASEGWRLVQIFSPILPPANFSKYFELIFEREK